MTWVKSDDNEPNHPKVFRAGVAAYGFFQASKCYCARNLTDGFIPTEDLPLVFPGVTRGLAIKLAALLTECGLFEVADDGYNVHDYLDYNPSSEEVRAQRAAARDRQARRRRNKLGEYVTPDVTRESRCDIAVSHTTPSRPVPSRPDIEALTTSSGNGCPTPRRSNPYRNPARDVLAWLNEKAGKNFEFIDANLKLIEARLREGRQPWQLKKIVSVKLKDWNGDPKMRAFLRPETLFGKTKCAQYIGELPPPDPEDQP